MPVVSLENFRCHYIQIAAEAAVEQRSAEDLPEILMVHGLATNLSFWYPVAVRLAQVGRVTLFDLRGHGKSSMPMTGYTPASIATDLQQLITLLQLRRPHLICHSFAGHIALQYLSRHPESISSLILADVRLKAFQSEQKLIDFPHREVIQTYLEQLGLTIPNSETETGYRLLTEMARLKVEQPELCLPAADVLHHFGSSRTAKQWLKLIDMTQAWQELLTFEDISLVDLRNLYVPTFALYGERSPNLKTAYGLQSVWSHLKIHWVANAGHFFPIKQPQLIAALIQDFYTSLPTRLPKK